MKLLRRLLFVLPVTIFAVIAGYFYWGLDPLRDRDAIESKLIDQPVPAFDLPAVEGLPQPGLAAGDLEQPGEVVLVNVFASWCAPCRIEHPILMELADQGVTVYGINYRDEAEAAADWLADLGNPYAAVGFDPKGRGAVAWGISGVPETFVVDAQGTIRYRHAGPIHPQEVDSVIRPLLDRLDENS